MSSSEPLIHLADVKKVFYTDEVETHALSGIHLDIKQGEYVSIAGPSGCGKSTLLSILGLLDTPTDGKYILNSHPVENLSLSERARIRNREVGFIFQSFNLIGDLTVYENVAFQMREHTALSERMIRDLVLMKLHAVGLRGAHRLMPSELSGGMARRVALARAIALDPMLIMYDEPFTGLDPISLGAINNLIRKLNDALGATSIVVTHDVFEALELVDYVYYMSDGVIVAQGTPEEMRASTDPLVRQFMKEDFREVRCRVVNECVQHRVFEKAERRVGVHASHVNVVAFFREARRTFAGLLLGEETAIFQFAHDGIPPLLRFQRKLRCSINIPDDEASAEVRVIKIVAIRLEL